MFLIIAIITGILVGLGIELTTKKERSQKTLEQMDHLLLVYLFPLLLMLTGLRLQISWSSAKVTSLMTVAMVISLGVGYWIAKNRLKLGNNEHGKMMMSGFLVLAICSNTGHGVMLASSATTDATILSLLMGPMYVGFLMVIFLPMFLVDRKAVGGFMKDMILWHPISYASMAGFASVIDYRAGYGWLVVIATRLILKRDWKGLKPFAIVFMGMVAYRLGGDLGAAFFGYYPLIMTFLTAVTIGIKIRGKMEASHWTMVRWIIAFGLIIAPAIGLGLAKLTGCSYEEAFVLVYSLSQPPAYLGMLWLRGGKFGKDFSISEKSFAIQGIIAYGWAILMPDFLQFFF